MYIDPDSNGNKQKRFEIGDPVYFYNQHGEYIPAVVTWVEPKKVRVYANYPTCNKTLWKRNEQVDRQTIA